MGKISLQRKPTRKGLAAIYHQEIIQDVVLFTSQRAANFYNKIFSSLDFALQNHSGGLPDNPQYCLSQAQLSVRGLVFVRLFQDIQRFCLVDPLFLRYSFRVLLISNLLIYTIQSADFGHQNRQYFCFILCFIQFAVVLFSLRHFRYDPLFDM